MKTKKDESAWAAKIVAKFGKEIKILKNFARGELAGGGTIQVRVPGDWIAQDNTLVYLSKGEFRNASEVWRAQQYIGRRILYHIVKNGSVSDADQSVFKILEAQEKCNYAAQMARKIIKTVEEQHEWLTQGYTSEEELDKTIDDLLSGASPEVRMRVEKVLYGIKDNTEISNRIKKRETRNNLVHLGDKKADNEW